MDRVVAIALFPGFQPLDVSGPMEVFAGAAEALARSGAPGPRPRVVVVGPRSRSESGLEVVGTPCDQVDPASIDTLIVPGGSGTRESAAIRPIRPWLLASAARARRVASVCTGAFVLAELGLLDGHRAATHWAWARSLARTYPAIEVDPDAIFVRSGDRWTSAGVTAGFDLALALVEDDHGAEIAAAVARWLVLPLRRSGGQSQYASELWNSPSDRPPVRAAQDHVRTHLDADLSIAALAKVAALSPRQFQRVFTSAIGIPPSAFVARARLDEARRLLETTALPIPRIAARCGFGTAEHLRRAFVRTHGVPPSTWRTRR